MPGPFEFFTAGTGYQEFSRHLGMTRERALHNLRASIARWRDGMSAVGEVASADGYLRALDDLQNWIKFQVKRERKRAVQHEESMNA